MKKFISKKGFTFFFISLFSTVLLISCIDSDIVDKYSTFEGKMIGEYLSNDSTEYSEFIAALKKVNALSLLNTYGKYTCFIPTNEAMEKFYQLKGKTLDQLDSTEIKDLVFYHIIDGESANSQTYRTTDYGVFGKGPLPTKNMIGRYIYTSLTAGNWYVDKSSKILKPDLLLINGVVHVIDKVLEGNKDLLPEFIAANQRFSLFSRALQETGLADSLKLVDDPAYIPGANYTYQRATYYNVVPAPKTRKFGFTAFMESDSIMNLRKGIDSFDKLVAFAKTVYDEMYPEDAGITDFRNPKNSLNRFVAYHLVNKKMTTDKIVVKFGYAYCWSTEYTSTGRNWFQYKNKDDKYMIEQYLVPMAPNTLMAVQLGNYFNFRDPDTGEAASVLSSKFKGLITDKSKFITLIDNESNNECLNGIYHSLNNMLVYDKSVESKVLRKRLRMEFRTFLPELDNNDFNFEVHGKGPTMVPDGYCKNLTYNQESKVRLILFPANVHPYLYGDDMLTDGFINLKIKVGPVPAGKYEVRIGFQVRSTTRGITQYYFDGKPCGIPLDQKRAGSDPEIGWQQVYSDALDAGYLTYGTKNNYNLDDYDGLENDKQLRNRGYMKGPDIYTGAVFYNDWQVTSYSARNSPDALRRILGIYSFDETTTHTFQVVQMSDGDSQVDYIEFVPVDMIPEEDTH